MKNEYTIKSALDFLESWIKYLTIHTDMKRRIMIITSTHTSYNMTYECYMT